MMTLEDRLRSLGDALDLDAGDDGRVVDAVLARLDEPTDRRTTSDRSWLRVAAALVLVVALVAVAAPSSRRTVADWLGFDGVRIERRPDAPGASVPDPFGADDSQPDATEADATEADDTEPDATEADDTEPDDSDEPTEPSTGTIGSVVDVDGRDILVSEFVGSLDNPAIGKTVGDGTNVQQVEVGGELGLWIDGAPHDVSFFDEQGDLVFERFAGNTLLWQDGSIVRRLEGFADVGSAIEYAEEIIG